MPELRFFEEETAKDIINHRINAKTKRDLLSATKDFWENREIIIEFPRWIRNYYKLWESQEEHADDVSGRIVERVKELLNNTTLV